MQYTYSYTSLIQIPIIKPIGDENSEHGLWFLLCSKSSMLCSIPIVILLFIHTPILKPIDNGKSEHRLWFLLCSKSSMQRMFFVIINSEFEYMKEQLSKV